MKGVLNWLESDIEAFLVFRVSLGYQRKTYEPQLRSFMSYVLESHTEASVLSKPLVMEYLEQQNANLHTKANTLRLFGLYLNSIGKEAYVLPEKMFRNPRADLPYIFSDQELSALFSEIDHLGPEKGWMSTVAPVLFRLIYTCGLRPKEGRELHRKWINFKTGEIRIEKSKGKKDRTVVMSDDMLALCRVFDKKRTAAHIDSEYFFAKPDGTPFTEPMIHNTFITCWKRAAGLPPGGSCLQTGRSGSARARPRKWLLSPETVHGSGSRPSGHPGGKACSRRWCRPAWFCRKYPEALPGRWLSPGGKADAGRSFLRGNPRKTRRRGHRPPAGYDPP